MPIVRPCDDTDQIELGDILAYLDDIKIDARDEAAMLEAAPMLKKLANNRTFVADLALKELKERKNLDSIDNNYTPQTIMLTKADRGYFMRANFWPSENDHILRASGPKAFFYHAPHDHNFNFLTVGYMGPGYRSNYYEYDYGAVEGFAGEPVALRFVEHSALSQGKVMLYRAFRDVHDQQPGDAMSMSINIMENSMRGNFMDQYSFDTDHGCVDGILNRIGATALLPMLAVSGGDDAQDFLTETSRSHRSGRVRCIATDALAAVQSSAAASIEVHRRGAANADPQVRGHCLKRIAVLEPLLA
ncbi:hypothetical protein ASE86_04130 [Sphingomonas sp. Leaf33]|uniref:hypothetical protein n=1 Tax=Sphingomonas sp. Leaf33 TaxID=1736215 RepID=UPI0006F46E64|nr:hypothetical protein [Sphingomonas sp. Leaf33]KQN25435.1 hypothetical protein ASE86_04130 [Sphingomonas sp. Leaf33]